LSGAQLTAITLPEGENERALRSGDARILQGKDERSSRFSRPSHGLVAFVVIDVVVAILPGKLERLVQG
jgi:hypothetical protein